VDLVRSSISLPSEAFLAGSGEMAARIRQHDWASSRLGPPAEWPQSLRSAVSILLPSRAQICLFWGRDLVTIYNDAYRPTLGVKHPWALGRPAREVWSEFWGDVLQPLLEGVLDTGNAFWASDHPFFLERHGYPEETFFDISYDPVRDESGGVGGVFCIVSETTGRVVGERRLRTLRDLSALASEATTQEDAFRAAARVLGASREDVPFAVLFDCAAGHPRALASVGLDAPPPGPWPLEQALAGEVLLRGNAIPFRDRLPGGAWPEAPREVLVLPMALAGSEPVGVLVAGISPRRAFDESYRGFLRLVASHVAAAVGAARALEHERARAEALAEIDRAKSMFFSNVSHEFRTPLTLMLAPLEDVLAAGDVPEARRDLVALALRNGRRLQKLVNALLDFSRIEAGRMQLTREPVELGGYTAELASGFRSAIEHAGLEFRVECAPLSSPVEVDREAWEKIVLNLVSNAFKYTLAGSVSVELRERDGHAVLRVSDTGSGIPEHELPNLFKRFHRVAGARARTLEGTGIGLALVQELVKLHGGTLAVESREGEGSTFTVTVPCATAQASPVADAVAPAAQRSPHASAILEEASGWVGAAAAAPREPEAGATRGDVVLADDNGDMRAYVQRLLEEDGYRVTAVADGAAALRALEERRPDLLLADVMMPELDGFELLEAVRTNPALADIPVVLVSARAGRESKIAGLESGADDYLVKPFAGAELRARVAAAIRIARLRRTVAARERTLRLDAERAVRLKDEFLATLSHELRTPLNAIAGWTHLLRQMPGDVEKVRQGIEVIDRNTRLQAQLISDLLDMNRIMTGKMRLEREAVELPAILLAAAESLAPAAEARGVHVETAFDGFAGTVLGDAARIQQIVWNLLSNAIKFTPGGGHVRLALARAGERAVIVVSDTGQGIRPEHLPRIFQRFWQADSGTTRHYGGLGIGLALVRQLTELHGGHVRAASDGEGRGATFHVELPLAPAGSAGDAPVRVEAVAHPPDLAGLRVLALDDDPDSLEVLRHMLAAERVDVVTAASAQEAAATLERMPFDAILSDVAMARRDGYQFIAGLRRRGIRIPAVALTAFAGAEDRSRALAAGFHAHVAKPVDPQELLATLASVTSRVSPLPAG